MGEHHVPAFGALGLDHRGEAGEAAAALAVRHQRFAHLIDVVGQDESDLGALRPRQPWRHDDRGGKAKRDGTAAEGSHVPKAWRFQTGRCSSTHHRRPAMLRKMNRPESIVRADSPAASAHAGRIGVLIVNLGTPDATDAGSVRRYLREFLSDTRVIENQGLIWKFVLHAIILPRRPRAKGRDYEKIWNRERNESPLKTITRAQAAKLRTTIE